MEKELILELIPPHTQITRKNRKKRKEKRGKMKDFDFQTSAILNDRIAQHLRRNPQLAHIAYPAGLRGHLMQNLQLSKGGEMINGKNLARKLYYYKGGG